MEMLIAGWAGRSAQISAIGRLRCCNGQRGEVSLSGYPGGSVTDSGKILQCIAGHVFRCTGDIAN